MTYGKKLQPGDRWMVGRRWVEWDGEKVKARCGLWYGPLDFEYFAHNPEGICNGGQTCKCDGCQASCIAQQIICEGLLP